MDPRTASPDHRPRTGGADSANAAGHFEFGRILVGVVFSLLVIPLIVYGFLGFSARYVADDFCTASVLVSRGFAGSQQYWYESWTGRYSFTAMVNLLEMLGPQVPRGLPAALALLWIGCAGWAFKQATELGGRKASWEPYLIATAGLGATYAVMASRFQAFFWQTGLVTYLLPTTLLIVQVGLVLSAVRRDRGSPSWVIVGLVGAAAFLVGGFSEVTLAIQVVAYAVLTALVFWVARKPQGSTVRWAAVAGLAGSVMALGVILLAPGNQVRLELMPGAMRPSDLVLAIARYTGAFVAKSILRSPAVVIACATLAVGLGAAAQLRNRGPRVPLRRTLRIIVLWAGAAGALILASMVAPAAATAAYPVDRALLPATVILVLVSMGVGWALGEAWAGEETAEKRPRLRAAAVRTLCVLGALTIGISTTLGSASMGADLLGYAMAWDRRDAQVRESLTSNTRDLLVRPLPHIGDLAELEEDPGYWVNQCFALYYGADSVQAR